MEDFTTIYKILKALHDSMDYDEFDIDRISPQVLGVSENRRFALLKMLVDSGYIEGITEKISVDGQLIMEIHHPRITLKGLEYLEENSLMKRTGRLLKGIKEVTPLL